MTLSGLFNRLSSRQLLLVGAAAGWIVVGGMAAILGAGVVFGGWYDVSASRYHGPLTAWVIHTTMIHSVKTHAGASITPMTFSQEQVREGFPVYQSHCAVCHGAPGVARARWVNGMNPPPPYLMDAARRFSPTELRFIVSEGIKMTAMPSWKGTLSPEQIGDVVALLEAMPNLTAAQYRAMGSPRNQTVAAH